MLTQTLAKELAPKVRVNGVSPGSILWPQENAQLSDNEKSSMLEKIVLKRPRLSKRHSRCCIVFSNG